MMEMSEEDKDKLPCDEIFALYLRHVSKLVNESYYRNVLRFVLLYRECLNEYGWLRRRDHFHKAF
jgi:flagellar biosynthesis GTPase FlhF